MAGKHYYVGQSSLPGNFVSDSLSRPPTFPGSLVDRAYAEGRQANQNGELSTTNPHPFASELFQSWFNGWQSYTNVDFAGAQFQTNIEGNP